MTARPLVAFDTLLIIANCLSSRQNAYFCCTCQGSQYLVPCWDRLNLTLNGDNFAAGSSSRIRVTLLGFSWREDSPFLGCPGEIDELASLFR